MSRERRKQHEDEKPNYKNEARMNEPVRQHRLLVFKSYVIPGK
jgi:hypothetical protein